MHVIGPDTGHEIVLGDFSGDGKIDIATRLHIYFQNTPTSWSTISAASYAAHKIFGLTSFDSGSGLGSLDLAGPGNKALELVVVNDRGDSNSNCADWGGARLFASQDTSPH